MPKANLVSAGIAWFMESQEQGGPLRHSAGLLRLVASTTLTLILAEPTHAAAQTRCEAKLQSCTAECYARYFSIDPKRNECVANCRIEENKCRREQAARQESSYAFCASGVFQDNHEPNGVVRPLNLAGN